MIYRIALLLIAVLVWGGLYLTGNDTHTADGIVFFGLVIGEGLLIFLQKPAPK